MIDWLHGSIHEDDVKTASMGQFFLVSTNRCRVVRFPLHSPLGLKNCNACVLLQRVNRTHAGHTSAGDAGRGFPTTQWDVLEILRTSREQSEKTGILDTLIRLYWRPVYCFILRRGYPSADAMDLTQGFFLQWLEKDTFLLPRRERGRFRTLLLTSVVNFLNNAHRSQVAQKRAPSGGLVSLDALMEKDGLPVEPVERDTPEKAFLRAWAREVLSVALNALRRECVAKGREAYFRLFQVRVVEPLLEGAEAPRLADLAKTLGLSSKEASNCLVTMRRAFQRLLREVVASYATSDDDIEVEIEDLLAVFSR